jgi:hypothetical protein
MLLFDTGLFQHLLNIISINFDLTPTANDAFVSIGFTLIVVFSLLVIFALWVAGSGMQYFSAMEANEALFLKERLAMIGHRARIRGLEREG